LDPTWSFIIAIASFVSIAFCPISEIPASISSKDIFLSDDVDFSFNSAFFSTVATIDYPVIVTNAAFGRPDATGGPLEYANSMALWQSSNAFSTNEDLEYVPLTHTPLATKMQDSVTSPGGPLTVNVLTPLECIDQYAQNYMSSRGILVLRLNGDENDPMILNTYMHTKDARSWPYKTPEGYSWICNQLDFSPEASQQLSLSCTANLHLLISEVEHSGWRPIPGRNETVHSCISEKINEHCRLEFSKHIGILVLCLNFAQMVLTFMIAFDHGDRPLLTIGDALASFLTHPDETTRGLCMWSNFDFRYERDVVNRWSPIPKTCEPRAKRHKRLYTGASYGTIVFCLFM
jgi:hypothetical protein